LVVIAIIALLVSILVPSLRRAKDLALRALCAANQRTVFTGANLYAAEFNARYPGGGNTTFADADRNAGNIMYFARTFLQVRVAFRDREYAAGEDCPHADIPGIGESGWSFLDEAASPLHCPARSNWHEGWTAHRQLGYFLSGLGVCGYGNGGGYTVAYGYPRAGAPASGPAGPRIFSMDVLYAEPWTPPYDSFYILRPNHKWRGLPSGGNVQTCDGAVRWIDADGWISAGNTTAGAGFPPGYYWPICGGLQKYGYTGHWFNGLELFTPDGTVHWGGSQWDAIFGY